MPQNPASKIKSVPSNIDFLQVITRHMPVILFALDTEGIFTYSDGPALELIGLKPGEVVGESVFEIYKGQSSILPEIKRALRTKKSVTATDFFKNHNFRVTLSPYSPNGNFEGLIGLAVDLTEKTRLEAERYRTISRIRRMAAHDARGALSGIISFLRSIARGEFLQSATENEKRIFELMKRNCEEVLSLTETMLQGDHSETSTEFVLHAQRVDLHPLFIEIYERAKPIAESKNQKLILNIEKAPLSCVVDPTLLHRAVNNLLLNAFEHSKPQGFVELTIGKSMDGQLCIRVKDEGPGMEPDQLRKVMKNAEDTHITFRSGQCSGMGLFIVRKIIELHGGRMKIMSEAHQGTKVSLHIPTNIDESLK